MTEEEYEIIQLLRQQRDLLVKILDAVTPPPPPVRPPLPPRKIYPPVAARPGPPPPPPAQEETKGCKLSGWWEADVLCHFPSSIEEGVGLAQIVRVVAEQIGASEDAVRKWRSRMASNGTIAQGPGGWRRTTLGDELASRSSSWAPIAPKPIALPAAGEDDL